MEEEKKEELQEEQENKNIEKDKKNKKFEKLLEENEKLKSDVNHWKNEYYRAYADTQNLRKSLEKDHQEAMRYRAEGFIEQLLPVLDSFHVVLSKEVDDPNLKNYLIGFTYIYRNMVNALENEGVKELAPKVGDKFDAQSMNAIEVEEVSEEEKEGLITKVVTNGYKLHDRLIRPANVIVSGHKKEQQEKENKEEVKETKFDA